LQFPRGGKLFELLVRKRAELLALPLAVPQVCHFIFLSPESFVPRMMTGNAFSFPSLWLTENCNATGLVLRLLVSFHTMKRNREPAETALLEALQQAAEATASGGSLSGTCPNAVFRLKCGSFPGTTTGKGYLLVNQ